MITEVGFEFQDRNSNPINMPSWMTALGKSSTLYQQ